MESAKTLLHAFHDPASREIYMEILDDTVEVETLDAPRWNVIRGYIRDRTLPTDILTRFDTVVLSLFLFQNHSLCYTFKSYEAMLTEIELAYKGALQWWKHTPRKIGLRIGPVAFAGVGAAAPAHAPAGGSQILHHV